MLIGLNIGYYRRARNLTQIELAESLEISSNYLSQIERGSLSRTDADALDLRAEEARNIGAKQKAADAYRQSPVMIP